MAAVVATIVIANVVETTFSEGKYFSVTEVVAHCTTHSFVSSIYSKPVTFSVPLLFKSPIRGLFFLDQDKVFFLLLHQVFQVLLFQDQVFLHL